MIKIVEQKSDENHSFLMCFFYHSLSLAHSAEVIKIVEQNSLENHSFLMCSSWLSVFMKEVESEKGKRLMQ